MAQLRRLEEHRPRPNLLQRLLGLGALTREGDSWYQGARGEIAAGRELARLGSPWLVLHAVPVGAGDSDIDHVVIGPAGVFTINTKHHAGKKVTVSTAVWVAGQRTDHLRNSRHEAERAGRLLSAAAGRSITVRPIVAIHGAESVTVRHRPRDVKVLRVRQLARWLKRQRPWLSSEGQAALRAAAENPRTWRAGVVGDDDPAALQAWFARLDKSVQAARWRRLVVGLAAFAVFAAVVLKSLGTLLPALVAALLPG